MKSLVAIFVLLICSLAKAEVATVPPEIMKFVGTWQGHGYHAYLDATAKKCDAVMDVKVTDKFSWYPALKGWWLVLKLNPNCLNYGKSEHYFKIEDNGLLTSSVYEGRPSHYQENIILLTWGAAYNSLFETEVLQSYSDDVLSLILNSESRLELNRVF